MRRRDFLKASALGASVSILDGCTTEEERFLVQRVRRTSWLPGESVWRPGVCRQCSAGCGLEVRVVDGDARKIEGNAAHPVNRGGVCALGHSLLQELYNPDRILEPQLRVGERGSGDFEAISWEAALAQVSERIASTPSDRIAIIGSDPAGLVGGLWHRLADAIGAPPPAFLESPELEVERRSAQIALGTADFPYFDIARADYVLSIGAPIVDRWRSPVHYTKALAQMRRGRPGRRGQLVQAESRMSLTAANADRWLPVRPGTEGLFARTVAGLLMDAGAASPEASQRYRSLFPGDPPSLEEGAEACDVRADWIEELVEGLGSVERRVAIGGGSAAAATNGLANVVAALGLNLLFDNLGSPGGVYAPAAFGLARGITPPASAATPIAEVAARLRGESASPVELLIVAEADPVHALPGGWGFQGALADVETIVTLSSFRDDTTLQADVVLPLATELERWEAVEPAMSVGVPVLGLVEPVTEPVGQGRHPGDVVIGLAAALGDPQAAAFPWDDFEELAEERIEEEQGRLPGGAGESASDYFDSLIEQGGIFGDGEPASAPPGPSGRAPETVERRFEGSATDFPLVLVPFESVRHGDGRGANRPWMQEMPDPLSTVMWNSWVEMSPVLADRLGVQDGDLIRVESPTGSIEALAALDATVRPDVICMPIGHGHVDYGRYAQGRGANVMDLVGTELVDGTSAPAWAATRVRVERLGEGRLLRFGRSHEEMGAEEVIPVGWAPHDTSRAARREAEA